MKLFFCFCLANQIIIVYLRQLRKKLAYATACCLAGEYLCSPVVFYELPINQIGLISPFS